jgi:hypothetical protein
MTCLDATFTLTPRSPFYWKAINNQAELYCYGADFSYVAPTDLTSLYTSNRFFFDGAFASNPALDYSQWAYRSKARFLDAYIDLRAYGPSQKQVALIFAFDVMNSGSTGRVQVYSDAGLITDQTLAYGDNQFMLELESVDQWLNLYFVHTGGYWFFKGLSAYVV